MATTPKTALIFTTHFPWEGGEIFYESELKIQSQKFDRIFLFPFEPRGNRKPLPENAETILVTPLPPGKKLRTAIVKRNLFSILGLLVKDFYLEKHKWKFLKQLRRNFSYMVYFHGIAEILSKELKARKLEGLPVFAYWCIDWAVVFAILKRKGVLKFAAAGLHGFDVYEDQNVDGYIRFRNLQFTYLDFLVPISEHGKNYCNQKWPGYERKFRVRRLGVSDQGQNPFDAGKIFTLVSCASTNPHKRILGIAVALKQIHFPLRWVHFGDGEDQEKLKAEIQKLPAHIQVELKGRTTNAEVIRFYSENSVNLMVHPSRTEGVPVSIMEAISFGIPVIGCDGAGGVPEIVTSETGQLIPNQFTTSELADAIHRFRESEKNSAEFRAGVRNFWERKFNAEKNYARFADLLARIAAGEDPLSIIPEGEEI